MRFFIYVLSSVLLVSCGQHEENISTSQHISLVEGDTIHNDFAEAFRIIQFDKYVQLDIIDPALDSVLFRYGLGVGIPKLLNDLGENISSIAALSSTHVGMMKALGLDNQIKGVSNKKYLCDTASTNEWLSYGELGQADPELFIKQRPSVIMYSGFKLDVPILNKLDEVGIPSMVNYDWKETHPLGRAEWLKVFGLLFNVEEEAHSKFQKIKKEYLAISESIKKSSTSPSVFVGTLYGDVFNVPAGESYMARILNDANVDYKYADTKGTASLNISIEEIITSNRDTDFWLNVAASSKKEIINMNANFRMMDAFHKGNVYTYFSNVNCFWEESAVSPQKVLSDLIHIFHPTEFEQSGLHYYEQIN